MCLSSCRWFDHPQRMPIAALREQVFGGYIKVSKSNNLHVVGLNVCLLGRESLLFKAFLVLCHNLLLLQLLLLSDGNIRLNLGLGTMGLLFS